MRALAKLMIVGFVAALCSAPALAKDIGKPDMAPELSAQQQQEVCRGWGVSCPADITPIYCIADDVCGPALPASALIRYDRHMDALVGHS